MLFPLKKPDWKILNISEIVEGKYFLFCSSKTTSNIIHRSTTH